jgi:hypothetical protein
MSKLPSPAYLRLQAARCQRLSTMCMDLGVARDLRMMADEYLADAAQIEQAERSTERAQAMRERRDPWQGAQQGAARRAQTGH